MELLEHIVTTALGTMVDVAPIVAILFGFQFLIIRKRPPHLRKVVLGLIYVLCGLTLFLVGLEEALFPLGRTMARQLTDPAFIYGAWGGAGGEHLSSWRDYYWVYGFAAAIGFATTAAEPSLIAVALKAEKISGGSVNAIGLRIAVAFGVAVGVALGAFRIVTGTSLVIYIVVGYLIVIVQTAFASRSIVPLAYDSGGVTTSTVTVPVITALGLGLASTIPGRSPLIDGFGLIAFASLFPIMSVLAYATVTNFLRREKKKIPELGTIGYEEMIQ